VFGLGSGKKVDVLKSLIQQHEERGEEEGGGGGSGVR
jgi:hypothetical protein